MRKLLMFLPATLLIVSCSTTVHERQAALFNGTNLSGWKIYPENDARLAGTWTVRDGQIVCSGKPMGYLYSEETYTNFVLTVEYRWAAGKTPGNSGLFARINGEHRPLPRAMECQLKAGDAGDLFGFHGMGLTQADGQTNRFRHVPKHDLAGELSAVSRMAGNEQPAGEWNRVVYTVNGSHVTVDFNGRLVNEANGAEVVGGPVALQSEGGELEFRDVRIQRLP